MEEEEAGGGGGLVGRMKRGCGGCLCSWEEEAPCTRESEERGEPLHVGGGLQGGSSQGAVMPCAAVTATLRQALPCCL